MTRASMLRKALLPLPLAATFVALLAASAPASAQTVTQHQQFLGWTATGNEVVSRVNVGARGINDAGDPIEWSYTVLEIANAKSGKVLNTYRVGQAVGPEQDAFKKAKPEAEGQKILKSLGLIAGVPGAANPAANMAVVSFSAQSEGEGVITDTCPGCSTCDTTLRIHLIHQGDRKVYAVRERSRTGAPFPPGDSVRDCPELIANVFWHPQGDRFAIVLSDLLRSNGSVVETLSVYIPEEDAASWPSVEIAPNPAAERSRHLDEEIQARKNRLASIADPIDKAIVLTQLGDLAMELGRHEAGRGYYESALLFDKRNLRAQLGQAQSLLSSGRTKDAMKVASKIERADRKAGLLASELGMFYLAAGDTKTATSLLQKSVDRAGADYTARLHLGTRILETNLDAGIAYMDNLLGAVPDNPDEALTALLHHAIVRMAEELIGLRDYELAARYVGRLDKQSPDARRLALELTALSAGDPARARLALEKTEALLQEDPSRCRLYYVRAMAWRQLVKPDRVLADLSAAVACDASLAEAHFYLGDLLAAAGNLQSASAHFETWLEMAPERSGDRARAVRRNHANRLIPRLKATGVILLSHDCNQRGANVVCRGVVSNTTGKPSGQVAIALTARVGGKRPRVTQEASAQIADVAPGATVDFSISIATPPTDNTLELTVGRDDGERSLNLTAVEAW